ncbi:dipeptide epimerase [Halobaculum sp. CBA1158]|uniref:dipeptide epimerase n=1 Tax=Halobaculum sp. CBA1158 TaxID=2904243 RepID=UPI001F4264F1|nr:dipeptide epimerase [Halobaculum sp. CBA1158]UIO99383.1 dipeptide epimerase [Halobaculum sp. CBA1158]
MTAPSSSLTTSFERVSLPLEHDFTISRGTTVAAENVIVRIADEGGMVGVGAAAPSAHYGETADTVAAVLPDLLAAVETVGDPHAIAAIEARMESVVSDNPAARCAVSIALHDLAAKRLGVPLYRLWGLNPADAPTSSFTIGIDDTATMREKTREAVDAGYSTLKLKLGTDRDREVVEAVCEEASDATLRVDANEAWTPRETARKSEWLADLGVEFIEQPLPASDPAGLKDAHERSVLPIAADESCVTLSDIPRIADRCDIANLKLMKCGGLLEAKRMIHAARAHGLEVMLGCMVESNAAIAAGCHLGPLLDYADLDGSLLLAEDADPFEGVAMPEGRIELGAVERNGTGAVERSE